MPKDVCKNCGKKIQVMSFRGTGICSENCKDALKKKTQQPVTTPVVTNVKPPTRPVF